MPILLQIEYRGSEKKACVQFAVGGRGFLIKWRGAMILIRAKVLHHQSNFNGQLEPLLVRAWLTTARHRSSFASTQCKVVKYLPTGEDRGVQKVYDLMGSFRSARTSWKILVCLLQKSWSIDDAQGSSPKKVFLDFVWRRQWWSWWQFKDRRLGFKGSG